MFGGLHKLLEEGMKDFFKTIVDDYCQKPSIYSISNKANVFKVFRNHVLRAERFLDKKVKAVRSDNGNLTMTNSKIFF